MNKKTTRRALTTSVISLLICVAMLMGTTFAWFTDSVTSGRNTIVAGNLDVVLEYYVDGAFKEVTKTTALFNDSSLWEPGHTEVAYLKVSNAGTLALKYQLAVEVFEEKGGVNVSNEAFKLSDHLVFKVVEIDESAVGTYTRDTAKTVAGNVKGLGEYNSGEKVLEKKGDSVCVALIVYMPETVGNEANYRGTSIPTITMGTSLVATQYTYEKDSFDEKYDEQAPLNFTNVSSLDELKAALEAEKPYIVLTKDIDVDEMLTVDYDAVIDGAGKTVGRSDTFTGTMFTVTGGATLALENVTVDGGAVWTGTADATLGRGTVNGGVKATGNIVATEANSHIVLNDGAVLQNNDGAHAVNLGTRIGATLTLNGGQIINNNSDSGAVWGGGNITVNDGSKINGNSSTGLAGAIRMVGKCNLTMNGGEISNNKAVSDGGAIWGYGTNGNTSVYNLNGGKMNNNVAGGTGGAIYTGTYSTVNISGDFEMCNNTAADSGAMRLTGNTGFNMTGGKIEGNVSINNSDENGFYGWNPIVNISGGELVDDVTINGGHTPVIGGDGITGVIHFAISTNHNTVSLAKDFGTIKFTVAEGTNFAAFNFKPAADYTYTAGDEAKLVCLNAGYETYWDAATSTFRLQAK